MKWFFYNLAFALVFPALLPGFLVRMLRRGGYRARMGDRFALYPKEIIDRFRAARDNSRQAPVWVHAVSVGEVQVALQLMREWRKAEPDVRFCFSTTSSTGWKIAEKGVGECDTLIYNPLDFPNFVKSALRTVKPRAIILTESEIWPVFIRRAKKLGIPLFLINARVSDRSAPRYKMARWFFKDVFSCFARIFAQSRLDEQRLVAAGAPSATVEVTGSFKFDVAHRNPAKEDELRKWIESGRTAQDAKCRILLGASTWPGEDEVLLDLYATLPDDVILVIAPRHFEKADAVEANIIARGFASVRRSTGKTTGPQDAQAARQVFLADTTGELMGLYGIADAVFVGKSLCEHGSQNMIEPCLCGKPTVVGPYTENFRPVMSDLLDSQAILQVRNAKELGDALTRWLSPEGRDEARELGDRAQKAVAARLGVVPRCVGEIRDALAARGAPSCEEAHGAKTRSKWLWLVPAAICVSLVAALCLPKREKLDGEALAVEAASQFRYKAIPVISRFLARIEKPGAKTVFDIDFNATEKNPQKTPPENGADAVFVTGTVHRDWDAVKNAAKEDAAVVWSLDVRKMSMREFKDALDSFPCADAHLWMPAENEWVLSGCLVPASVNIGDMLEAFGDEEAVAPLADALCDSLPELFANYAGDRITCKGAFTGNLDAIVAPEYFVTQDIPDVGWVAPGDLDEDILEATAREMRSLMLVRRSVIEGNMLAKDGRTDDAIEKWANAALRNPHDTMLLARIHRLAVNAVTFENVGNIKAAAKCYETMLCIRPTDISAVRAYANCLRRLGRDSMANDVMKRVQDLQNSLGDLEGKQ